MAVCSVVPSDVVLPHNPPGKCLCLRFLSTAADICVACDGHKDYLFYLQPAGKNDPEAFRVDAGRQGMVKLAYIHASCLPLYTIAVTITYNSIIILF